MRKPVVTFDSPPIHTPDKAEAIEEVEGSLKRDDSEEKLMHTVIDGGKDEIEHGRVIVESINQGIISFNPDMIFRNLVNNFKMARNLYGETLIRKLSGYDPNYVRKNINIPEFKEQLKGNIDSAVEDLRKRELVDREDQVTPEALKLSAMIMYMEELDKLKLKGWGEKDKKRDLYGEKEEVKDYRKARYRDVAVQQSVKQAIRRQHSRIMPEDLKVHERRKKGRISMIYALDASGSMKGRKLGTAKKAGMALAYKAIQERNKVGLIVFGSEIKKAVEPTQDFRMLLEELGGIRAGMETDIAKTIKKAVELFPKQRITKHLMLITDALPTKGHEPITETLEAVSFSRDNNVTISVLGINLDRDGSKLAKKIVEIGEGRLYKVHDLEDMDAMVLEDYYSFS